MSISMWGQVRRGRFFVYVSAVFVLSFEAHLRRVRTYNSVVWMFEAKIPSYVYTICGQHLGAARSHTQHTHKTNTGCILLHEQCESICGHIRRTLIFAAAPSWPHVVQVGQTYRSQSVRVSIEQK